MVIVASSRGLVVKAEDSWLKGRGFESWPHCGDHISCTIHLDQSMEAKIEWNITWHCCICCNPAKGRVDFEDGWLIKSSFIRMKWKSLSANQDQIPTKKKKKKKKRKLVITSWGTIIFKLPSLKLNTFCWLTLPLK